MSIVIFSVPRPTRWVIEVLSGRLRNIRETTTTTTKGMQPNLEIFQVKFDGESLV